MTPGQAWRVSAAVLWLRRTTLANTRMRIFVAAALTLLLFLLSDPRAILMAVKRADPELIGLAFGLVLVDRVVMAHRWHLLLGTALGTQRPGFQTIFEVFAVSTFLGTFLPTSVGGEALRVVAMARRGLATSRVLASILMDRVLGVVSMLLMGLAGVLLARSLLADPAIATALAVVAAASIAATVPLFSRRALAGVSRLIDLVAPGRWRSHVHRFLVAMWRYGKDHRILVAVLAESVVVQLLRVTQAFLVGQATGLHQPYTAYLALIPLALLVLLLPISVGGMGTGQAAFVLLFGRVGVTAADAFTLGTLLLLLALLGNVPGGLLYARSGGETGREG